MAIDWVVASETYKRDGAVHIPGLLNAGQLDAALKAWEWSLANPTPANAPKPEARRHAAVLCRLLQSRGPGRLPGHAGGLADPRACARLWGTRSGVVHL